MDLPYSHHVDEEADCRLPNKVVAWVADKDAHSNQGAPCMGGDIHNRVLVAAAVVVRTDSC